MKNSFLCFLKASLKEIIQYEMFGCRGITRQQLPKYKVIPPVLTELVMHASLQLRDLQLGLPTGSPWLTRHSPPCPEESYETGGVDPCPVPDYELSAVSQLVSPYQVSSSMQRIVKHTNHVAKSQSKPQTQI